jgi:hypothetical protein
VGFGWSNCVVILVKIRPYKCIKIMGGWFPNRAFKNFALFLSIPTSPYDTAHIEIYVSISLKRIKICMSCVIEMKLLASKRCQRSVAIATQKPDTREERQ